MIWVSHDHKHKDPKVKKKKKKIIVLCVAARRHAGGTSSAAPGTHKDATQPTGVAVVSCVTGCITNKAGDKKVWVVAWGRCSRHEHCQTLGLTEQTSLQRRQMPPKLRGCVLFPQRVHVDVSARSVLTSH